MVLVAEIARSRSVLPLSSMRKTRIFYDSFYEYHVFADASQAGYGACVYLRCVNPRGEISCELLISKGHVAPITQCTVPRLELQAAVTAAKLVSLVSKEMKLDSALIHCWTDSMIVLGYISNETRRFRTFVENRVAVIRKLTNVEPWHHVRSDDNPVDLVTAKRSLISGDQTDFL